MISTRIPDFDVWRPGYAGATVLVVNAGNGLAAPIFSDPLLTVPLSNPVTLITWTDQNGQQYGKFFQPIYTATAYYLSVNSEVTGTVRVPITDMASVDVSGAVVSSVRGTTAKALSSWLDLSVPVSGYGVFTAGNGAVANTATLVRAIGAVAAQGGGEVLLPAGNNPLNGFTLPQGCVLRGTGQIPTVLTTNYAGVLITLGGDGSGLRDVTIDGINLQANSIGVDALAVANPVFERVLIKRFETGMRMRGLVGGFWRDLSIDNCTKGTDLRGDADAAGTHMGNTLIGLTWSGGVISGCTSWGMSFECVDRLVQNVVIEGVIFSNNIGAGLRLIGNRGFNFVGCRWSGNTAALKVDDGSLSPQIAINTTQRLTFTGGSISGGSLSFNGLCVQTVFDGTIISNASFVLSVPTNPILLRDCITDGATTFTGDTTKVVRQTGANQVEVAGITTDASAITAWQLLLDPGQSILVEAKCIARRRDGIAWGNFWISAGANRPGATLPYNTQTANFAVGAVLAGITSGASARITADADAGASGTLTIRDLAGTFIVGETVADSSGGSAKIASGMTVSDAALDGGGSGAIRAAATSAAAGYSVAIDVSGAAVRVRVTGAASNVVEWLVVVAVVRA